MLAHRSDLLLTDLRAGGVVGLATPLGLGVPLIVLSSAGLESHRDYLAAGFQIAPAIPLLMVGSVMALLWTSRRLATRGSLAPRLVIGAGIAIVISSVALSLAPSRWLFTSSANPSLISRPVADGLRAALRATPANAQVIAQVQVVGRFSQRRSVQWAFFGASRRLPISEPTVVLVVLRAAGSPENRTLVQLRHRGARVLVDHDGVEAVLWRPPAGQRSLLVAP